MLFIMGFHSYKRVVTHCNDGHSHSWQVKCMSTSRQTHCKCLTHTPWWNTRSLYGNDPPVILMHSQCITSVHTYAHQMSFTSCLVDADGGNALPHTRAHSCIVPRVSKLDVCCCGKLCKRILVHIHRLRACYGTTAHTLAITWRCPHRCRKHT